MKSSILKNLLRNALKNTLADGGGVSIPTPPYNQQLIVDDLGNYVVDDSGNYLTTFISYSISIAVEDGASSPRSLTAADISTIGYYQIFSSVRATPGAVLFTPVDLPSAGASWQSGGIYDSPAGTLRIDLPTVALAGDPDEIEIEIVPVSGTVYLPDPIYDLRNAPVGIGASIVGSTFQVG